MIVSDVRILRPGCWTGRQASVAAGGEWWSGGGEQSVPSQHRDQRCRANTDTDRDNNEDHNSGQPVSRPDSESNQSRE